ncbi:MAG: hypothetical protein HZB15_07230 [Actinobacteria bacterium]|nr:hypothetical protein [Actinomycetota bacterium]
MTDIERLATSTSTGIANTIRRLAHLVVPLILATLVVGVATFATGAWVFDNSAGWLIIGGVVCAIPVIAAIRAWWLVRGTANAVPKLLDELRTFLPSSSSASGVLVDYDSGIALGMQSRSFRQMRNELEARRTDLPALWTGIRAIVTVPGLAAIAILGIVLVGALGTILLIAGLI